MARVQLVIPDEDRDRFIYQARQEGMTLSAWLRAAAHHRLRHKQKENPFEETADLKRFFEECDALEGPSREPDWEEYLAVINESRLRSATGT